MVFVAEVDSELQKKFEFDEVITEEDSVICLSNASNVDVSSNITEVSRSTGVNEFDTKVRLMRDSKLFIIDHFVEITAVHPALLEALFIIDGTHEVFIPIAESDSVLEPSEDEREILVSNAIEIEAPSKNFEEYKVKGTLCIEEECIDRELLIQGGVLNTFSEK